MKIVKKFQMKIVVFTAVKYHSVLHGRVFVMLGVEKAFFDTVSYSFPNK